MFSQGPGTPSTICRPLHIFLLVLRKSWSIRSFLRLSIHRTNHFLRLHATHCLLDAIFSINLTYYARKDYVLCSKRLRITLKKINLRHFLRSVYSIFFTVIKLPLPCSLLTHARLFRHPFESLQHKPFSPLYPRPCFIVYMYTRLMPRFLSFHFNIHYSLFYYNLFTSFKNVPPGTSFADFLSILNVIVFVSFPFASFSFQ